MVRAQRVTELDAAAPLAPSLGQAQDEHGQTPLHRLCKRSSESPAVARLLLHAGVRVRLRATHSYACAGSRLTLRDCVHPWYAQVNKSDDAGNTALHLAVANGHADTVRLLLECVPAELPLPSLSRGRHTCSVPCAGTLPTLGPRTTRL